MYVSTNVLPPSYPHHCPVLPNSNFSRAGLTITDTTSKNQLQIHIEISCPTDTTGAFCAQLPAFNVPGMGCPEGQVMVAIDQCGEPCELLEGGCSTPKPTASPVTPAPTASPAESCILCTDNATPWMIGVGYTCPNAPNWLINKKCNKTSYWIDNLYCERSCESAGFGYHASSCCESAM